MFIQMIIAKKFLENKMTPLHHCIDLIATQFEDNSSSEIKRMPPSHSNVGHLSTALESPRFPTIWPCSARIQWAWSLAPLAKAAGLGNDQGDFVWRCIWTHNISHVAVPERVVGFPNGLNQHIEIAKLERWKLVGHFLETVQGIPISWTLRAAHKRDCILCIWTCRFG